MTNADLLESLAEHFDKPPYRVETQHRMWRVTVPGRDTFEVFCAQGATADEMLQQWPSATLEVARGQ